MIRHLIFSLVFLAFEINPAWGQAARTPDQPNQSDFECTGSAASWSCYGSMEIFVSMELDADDKVLPMFRRQVIRFVNREVLIENESFRGGPHGERTVGTYFIARPSAVALASGWDTWQNPAKEAGHILDEFRNVCEILRAAFPNGPEMLSKDWQTATATVTEYIYPIGEQKTHKTISARKVGNGAIYFSYKGVGEPMGPYQITGIWNSKKSAPQRDDTPVPYTGSNRRFETLGQARASAPLD